MNEGEFKALIEKIHKENSLNMINFLIDEIWENHTLLDSQKKMLKEIQDANDLDRIRLICAEFLGYEKEATELRAWLLRKPKRQYS